MAWRLLRAARRACVCMCERKWYVSCCCIWCNEILSSCRMYFIENNDNRTLSLPLRMRFGDADDHNHKCQNGCTQFFVHRLGTLPRMVSKPAHKCRLTCVSTFDMENIRCGFYWIFEKSTLKRMMHKVSGVNCERIRWMRKRGERFN